MRRGKRPPVHPGRILRQEILEPLGITQTRLAEILGISRKTVSKIVNEKGSITADMAGRLSRAFRPTPDFWMNLQKNFDLWYAEKAADGWKGIEKVEEKIPVHAQGM